MNLLENVALAIFGIGRGNPMHITDLAPMELWRVTEVYSPGNLVEVRNIMGAGKDPEKERQRPAFILDASGHPELREKGCVFHPWPDGQILMIDKSFW